MLITHPIPGFEPCARAFSIDTQEKLESFIAPEHDCHRWDYLDITGYQSFEESPEPFSLVDFDPAVKQSVVLDLAIHADQLHAASDQISRVGEGDRNHTGCPAHA